MRIVKDAILTSGSGNTLKGIWSSVLMVAKKSYKPHMVVHVYNPTTWKAKAGGLP